MLSFVMVLGVVTALVVPSAQVVFLPPDSRETETSFWMEHGLREIKEALHQPRITNKAKNVILFLGDGMGVTAATVGRILKGQKKGNSGEEGSLVWDRFSNIALLKTYNLDRQVPDSAATATAFLAGVKANYYTVGVNGHVKMKDCPASIVPENQVDTIIKWAQDAGKDTGVVTTAQVTHATPAAAYAKSPFRYWQCDTKMMADGNQTLPCKDIARQLVEDEPGRNLKPDCSGAGLDPTSFRPNPSPLKKCFRLIHISTSIHNIRWSMLRYTFSIVDCAEKGDIGTHLTHYTLVMNICCGCIDFPVKKSSGSVMSCVPTWKGEPGGHMHSQLTPRFWLH